MVHEPRPHCVRAVDQLPSGSRIPPLPKPLRRGSQMARLFLLGSVPLHGVRPAELPRKPARHRSVPAFARRQALPHGIPLPGGALHTGRRQRVARLADLCRFRPGLDASRGLCSPRSEAWMWIKVSTLWTPTIDLCLSCSPGPPPAQGRREDAHAVGAASPIRITDGRTTSTSSEFLPDPAPSIADPYVDFQRLFVFTLCSSFFVVRTKKNILLQRRYSHPVDKSRGCAPDRHTESHRIGQSLSRLVAAGQLLRARRTSG